MIMNGYTSVRIPKTEGLLAQALEEVVMRVVVISRCWLINLRACQLCIAGNHSSALTSTHNAQD